MKQFNVVYMAPEDAGGGGGSTPAPVFAGHIPQPDGKVMGSHEMPAQTPEQKAQGKLDAKARYDAAHPPKTKKEEVKKEEVKKEEPKKEEPKKEEVKKEEPKKEEVKKEELKKEEKKEEVKKEEPKKEEEKDPLITEKNPYGVPEKYLDKETGEPKIDELTKGYKEALKALSKKGITAVEKETDYVYTPSEGFTVDPKAETGFIIDSKELETFQKEAFEAGLTKEQFDKVMKKYEVVAKEASKLRTKPDPVHTLVKNSDKEGIKKLTETLTKRFGGPEQYTAEMTRAVNALEQFIPKDVNKDSPIFNHPDVIALLANIGKEIGEDRTTGKQKGNDGNSGSGRSPEEIRKDPEFKKNPKKFDKELNDAYARLYPNKR